MTKLKTQFKCKQTYKELDPLIKDILDFQTDNGIIDFKYEEFENIIFNHLFEKTTLRKDLESLKISFESVDLFEILESIDNGDDYFKEFLNHLNQQIEYFRALDLKKFTFLYALNIKKLKCEDKNNLTNSQILERVNIKCKALDIFKMILDLFNIQSVEKQQYYDERIMKYDDLSVSEKVLDIIGSYGGEVLRVDIEARDAEYALNKAIFRFEVFFGFLSFIGNRFRSTLYGGNVEDFRIFKIKVKHLFILMEKEHENDPFYIRDEEHSNEFKKDLRELKLIDLDSDFKITTINCNQLYKIIKGIDNESLLSSTYNAFSLYYLATSEKRLEYSFFKFWIVAEYLLKMSGKKNDDQMLNIMKNIVKLYRNDPFLSKRIRFLHKKRNELVHEGEINSITQDDRNLSKLIADCLLDFYLYSIQKFELNNLNDFDFLITNIGKEGANLTNHRKILNKIDEWKSSVEK